MQPPPFGLVILILLLIGVIIAIRSRKSSVVPKCQSCGAQSLIEINRNTLDTRTVDMHGSRFMPGADIRVQLEQEVTYRCTACQETMRVKVRETP